MGEIAVARQAKRSRKEKRLAWYITRSRFGIKFQGLVVVNGELKGP
jgi:hypothetical protein